MTETTVTDAPDAPEQNQGDPVLALLESLRGEVATLTAEQTEDETETEEQASTVSPEVQKQLDELAEQVASLKKSGRRKPSASAQNTATPNIDGMTLEERRKYYSETVLPQQKREAELASRR